MYCVSCQSGPLTNLRKQSTFIQAFCCRQIACYASLIDLLSGLLTLSPRTSRVVAALGCYDPGCCWDAGFVHCVYIFLIGPAMVGAHKDSITIMTSIAKKHMETPACKAPTHHHFSHSHPSHTHTRMRVVTEQCRSCVLFQQVRERGGHILSYAGLHPPAYCELYSRVLSTLLRERCSTYWEP